jgi:5'-nucleotidase
MLAADFGEVYVVAPLEQHSYAGHRVTEHAPLMLCETAPQNFSLTGTPADCVRVALTEICTDVDWVLAGINRGGNLGADRFVSGTVAAAREAALLGKPSLAISQFIRRGRDLDWNRSQELASPVLKQLLAHARQPGTYWNVNLPHLLEEEVAAIAECEPDNLPLDVRYRREGDALHYAGSYPNRPRTPGKDIDLCFGGAITVSRLTL